MELENTPKKSKKVLCACEQCGIEFLVFPNKIKKGGGKFCSKKCGGKAATKQVLVPCENCGKEVLRTPYYLKKNKFFYCSQECRGQELRKEKIEKVCQWCEQKFYVIPSKEAAKFCSLKCSSLSKENQIDYSCAFCGTKGKKQAHRIKAENCCSQSCCTSLRLQRGEMGGNRSKKGHHTSPKLPGGQPALYRSSWEQKFMEALDADDTVLSYEAEPMAIPYYQTEDSKLHRYFPDLVVTFTDQTKKLVEIKPHCFLEDQTNLDKWNAAKAFAEAIGWTFEVWTEKNNPYNLCLISE
jgi:hypothetical protein